MMLKLGGNMVLVDKGAVGGKGKGLLECLDCRSSQVTLFFGDNNNARVGVIQGLSRVQSNSRPADVLVDAWERAKPAAFDVSVTFPLTPATLHDTCNSAGVAAHKPECRKHSSNDPKCQK